MNDCLHYAERNVHQCWTCKNCVGQCQEQMTVRDTSFMERQINVVYPECKIHNLYMTHLYVFLCPYYERKENEKGDGEGYKGGREMNEKLKPCPFCGGKVNVYYSSFTKRFYVNHFEKSQKCWVLMPLMIGASGLTCLSDAYQVWNRRANENPIDESRVLSGDEYEQMIKENRG